MSFTLLKLDCIGVFFEGRSRVKAPISCAETSTKGGRGFSFNTMILPAIIQGASVFMKFV
jgi:hypothetical protein